VKGQINFEFLVAATVYLLAVGTVVLNTSSFLPDYRDELASASKHTEARAITSTMLTEPGSHDYGAGGPNWEKNTSTKRSVTGVGVASGFHELERDKVENLATIGTDGLNYSRFLNVTGVANQYRLNFIHTPMIDTPNKFRKDNPPSNPNIVVPSDSRFSAAGNTVYFGNETIGGTNLRILVTSHDGVFDTVRLSGGDSDWDFDDLDAVSKSVGGSIDTSQESYKLDAIQNRPDERGSAIFLSTRLNTFGASPDRTSDIIRLNRYATLNGEPTRLEVLVW
jgi:hypothetical protein